MRASSMLLAALLLGLSEASLSNAQGDTTTAAKARDPKLPAGEETARAALETTPRHGEFVDVRYGTGPALRTWISYPERKDKAGTVILIHEIYGLSDWMRGVADQLAREGFIAVVPDLISGFGPGGGGTDSAGSRDSVVRLVRALTPEETRARIDTVRAWATRLPAANGKVATMGFCWGGSRSFEYAAAEPPPQAAVVFYGSSPDSVTLLRVKAPVLAHYGADDARVNATIEPARRVLKPLKRTYDVNIYPGAGHGFLRQQTGREGSNLAATSKAWPATVAFLRKHLK